jgi:hypothetical protein
MQWAVQLRLGRLLEAICCNGTLRGWLVALGYCLNRRLSSEALQGRSFVRFNLARSSRST